MRDPAPILAATDFSQNGDMAVRRAARLAQERGTALELLTVVSQPRLATIRRLLGIADPDVEERIETDARARLAALQEELVREHGLQVHSHVLRGSAHQEILHLADEIGAELIVVGAHGERGLAGLLGGTAGKLLRGTGRPVLLVRKAASGPYRRVLVATDFSDSCRGALRTAAQLAPQAWLNVLHVLDPPYETKLVSVGVPSDAVAHYRESCAAEARQSMSQYVRAEACGNPDAMSTDIVPGDPSHALAERAKALRADLIAVGRSGQSFVSELLLHSISQEVTDSAPADVLVLHGAERTGTPGAAS